MHSLMLLSKVRIQSGVTGRLISRGIGISVDCTLTPTKDASMAQYLHVHSDGRSRKHVQFAEVGSICLDTVTLK
jgi:hypothetical protein